MATTYRQLMAQRDRIRRIVAANKGANPRVFGSVARDQQQESSDIDLVVDAQPGCSMLDIVRMEKQLTDMFGTQFDVNTERGLPRRWRDEALRDAIAL